MRRSRAIAGGFSAASASLLPILPPVVYGKLPGPPAKMAQPSIQTSGETSIVGIRADFGDDGGSPITNWQIEIGSSTDGGQTWGGFTTTATVGVAQKTRTYFNRSQGVTYRVRTRAVNDLGNGPWSDPSQGILLPLPFSPSQLSPVFWIDAQDTTTITRDGTTGYVTQWNDKGSSAGNLAPYDANCTITYTAADSVANGKPSISAPRNNDGMISATSLIVGEVYIIAAFGTGIETTFDNYRAVFAGSGSAGQPRLMGNINTPNFITSSALAGGSVFKNGAAESVAVLPMKLSLLRAVDTGGQSTTSYLRNVLNQANGQSRSWNGPLCEIIAFQTPLADADRANLTAYLNNRWSIVP